MKRSQRKTKLSSFDRVVFGLLSLIINPTRLSKVAIIIRPSTLLRFHQALVKKKYQQLFSSRQYSKPGPKGPSQELIDAIVEMKRRNSRFGCPRIAQEINKAFGVDKLLLDCQIMAITFIYLNLKIIPSMQQNRISRFVLYLV